MRSKALEGGFVEHLLELWMRYRNDEFGPFLQRASVEVHSTIFRPKSKAGTILLMPLRVVEGIAMMALPPLAREEP